MSREELLALASRCEQATVDQQATLLLEAFDLTNWRSRRKGQLVENNPQWLRFDKMVRVEAFESAAMSLVPEVWVLTLTVWESEAEARLEDDRIHPVRLPSIVFEAASAALAIASASLRARAAMGEGL